MHLIVATPIVDNGTVMGISKNEYEVFLKLLRANKVTKNSKRFAPTTNMKGKITKTNNSWIIDFGASDHVTHHENWLENVKTKGDYTSVTIPNSDVM